MTLIVLIVMIFGARQQAHILATAAELQRSKQSLEQSNLLLQTALKNMAHGLCMFDSEQRLVVCNERYGEMYGLGPEQVKPGTTLRSILEARVRAGMSPQDTEQYIEARLDEVAKRLPYYVENVLSDGHIYAVSHRPMPEGGWVATHIDITEQRRAEQELDETRKFLVSIIENIPVSVVVKDAQTRKYLLVNRAFETMLGIPRSEMLDRTSFDIHRPKDAKSIDDADTELLQDSDHVNYKEIEVNTPMRGPRMQSTSRMVIKNSRGEAKCIIAVIEDVTERKKAEQRIAFLAHHDALTGLANRAALIAENRGSRGAAAPPAGAVHRSAVGPRSFQAGQRYARPSRRRRAADRSGDPAEIAVARDRRTGPARRRRIRHHPGRRERPARGRQALGGAHHRDAAPSRSRSTAATSASAPASASRWRPSTGPNPTIC